MCQVKAFQRDVLRMKSRFAKLELQNGECYPKAMRQWRTTKTTPSWKVTLDSYYGVDFDHTGEGIFGKNREELNSNL